MPLPLPTLEPKQHQPQDLTLNAHEMHGVKEHPKAPGGMQSAKAEILENMILLLPQTCRELKKDGSVLCIG